MQWVRACSWMLIRFLTRFRYSKAEIDAHEAWVCRLVQDSKTGMSAVGAVREIIEGLTRIIEPHLKHRPCTIIRR